MPWLCAGATAMVRTNVMMVMMILTAFVDYC